MGHAPGVVEWLYAFMRGQMKISKKWW